MSMLVLLDSFNHCKKTGRRDIAERGGVGALLSAMKNHRGEPGVQDHGCAALQLLAQEEEVPAAVSHRPAGPRKKIPPLNAS